MASFWFKRTLIATLLSLCIAPSANAAPITTSNVPPRASQADLPGLEAKRQALFAVMLADPSNLDVSFEYAALSSQVGDLEGAIATLERMLIFSPGLPRLQLELGVLYYRLGAFETARTYFDAVMANTDVPDDVRANVVSYLAGIDQKASGHSLTGVVTLGARYQSNANAAPSNRSVSLNGLDFVLSDNAMAGADINGSVTLSLNYSQDLPGQGDRLDASLNAYGALYARRPELGIGVVEVSAGPNFDLQRFGLGGASLGLYAIAGGSMLDGTPYMWTAGVGTVLAATVTPETRLSLRGEYRREIYPNTTSRPNAANRTGDRYRASLGIEHKLNDAVTVFATTALERRLASVNFNSLWEASAQAGINIAYASPFAALPSPWSLTLSGGIAARHYDSPDLLISKVAEDDTEWSLQATQTVPLADRLTLQAQLGYRRIWSNYDTRKFDNVTAGLSLQKSF